MFKPVLDCPLRLAALVACLAAATACHRTNPAPPVITPPAPVAHADVLVAVVDAALPSPARPTIDPLPAEPALIAPLLPAVPPGHERAIARMRHHATELMACVSGVSERMGPYYGEGDCGDWYEDMAIGTGQPGEPGIHAVGRFLLEPTAEETAHANHFGLLGTGGQTLTQLLGTTRSKTAMIYLLARAVSLLDRGPTYDDVLRVTFEAMTELGGYDPAHIAPWGRTPWGTSTDVLGDTVARHRAVAAWLGWYHEHQNDTRAQWLDQALVQSRVDIATSTDPAVLLPSIERLLHRHADRPAAVRAMQDLYARRREFARPVRRYIEDYASMGTSRRLLPQNANGNFLESPVAAPHQ